MNTDTIQFTILHYLRRFGGCTETRCEELIDPVFYDDVPLVSYDRAHNDSGCYACTLHVAWAVDRTTGRLAPHFLERSEWHAARGYSAHGYNDELLSLVDGVERMHRAGVLTSALFVRPSEATIERAAEEARELNAAE